MRANTCWLASPGAGWGMYMLHASRNGGIYRDKLLTTTTFGFRPIVCLKSTTILTGNGNGTYTIK